MNDHFTNTIAAAEQEIRRRQSLVESLRAFVNRNILSAQTPTQSAEVPNGARANMSARAPVPTADAGAAVSSPVSCNSAGVHRGERSNCFGRSFSDRAGTAIAAELGLRFDGLQSWPAGDVWAFTDADPHSATWAMTFYMAPGSSLVAVARRLEEKRQEEEAA